MNLAINQSCRKLPPDETLFESIATGLECQGFVVLPGSAAMTQ